MHYWDFEYEYSLYQQIMANNFGEEENKVIRYIEESEYDLYESSFYYNEFGGERKEKYFSCGEEAMRCDCYCNFITSYWANCKSVYFTPSTLYGKMISRGEYIKWKGYFVDSFMAKKMGIRRKKYKIRGMKELLNNPFTCALIIHDGIKNIEENDNVQDKWYCEKIWGIARKIFEKNILIENNMQQKKLEYQIIDWENNLSDEEENIIAAAILGKRLHNKEVSFILEKKQARIILRKLLYQKK